MSLVEEFALFAKSVGVEASSSDLADALQFVTKSAPTREQLWALYDDEQFGILADALDDAGAPPWFGVELRAGRVPDYEVEHWLSKGEEITRSTMEAGQVQPGMVVATNKGPKRINEIDHLDAWAFAEEELLFTCEDGTRFWRLPTTPITVFSALPVSRRSQQKQLVTKTPGPHKFGCLMLVLPPDAAEKVLALGQEIPDGELLDDGRETEPHVTVKYGLHTSDPDEVRKIVGGSGFISIRLGKTKMLGDCLVIAVDSADLFDLNRQISSELECTDKYPKYVPHVTVAYTADSSLAGRDDLEGIELTFDSAVFSSAEGDRTTMSLVKRQKQLVRKSSPSRADVLRIAEDIWQRGVLSEIGVLRDAMEEADAPCQELVRWTQVETPYSRVSAYSNLLTAIGELRRWAGTEQREKTFEVDENGNYINWTGNRVNPKRTYGGRFEVMHTSASGWYVYDNRDDAVVRDGMKNREAAEKLAQRLAAREPGPGAVTQAKRNVAALVERLQRESSWDLWYVLSDALSDADAPVEMQEDVASGIHFYEREDLEGHVDPDMRRDLARRILDWCGGEQRKHLVTKASRDELLQDLQRIRYSTDEGERLVFADALEDAGAPGDLVQDVREGNWGWTYDTSRWLVHGDLGHEMNLFARDIYRNRTPLSGMRDTFSDTVDVVVLLNMPYDEAEVRRIVAEQTPQGSRYDVRFMPDPDEEGYDCCIVTPQRSTKHLVQKYVRRRGNKWVVLSRKGKVLGTHDTKREADVQLRAIEANKHKAYVPKEDVRRIFESIVEQNDTSQLPVLVDALAEADAPHEIVRIVQNLAGSEQWRSSRELRNDSIMRQVALWLNGVTGQDQVVESLRELGRVTGVDVERYVERFLDDDPDFGYFGMISLVHEIDELADDFRGRHITNDWRVMRFWNLMQNEYVPFIALARDLLELVHAPNYDSNNRPLNPGRSVMTPEGSGTVVRVEGRNVVVLVDGEESTFSSRQLRRLKQASKQVTKATRYVGLDANRREYCIGEAMVHETRGPCTAIARLGYDSPDSSGPVLIEFETDEGERFADRMGSVTRYAHEDVPRKWGYTVQPLHYDSRPPYFIERDDGARLMANDQFRNTLSDRGVMEFDTREAAEEHAWMHFPDQYPEKSVQKSSGATRETVRRMLEEMLNSNDEITQTLYVLRDVISDVDAPVELQDWLNGYLKWIDQQVPQTPFITMFNVEREPLLRLLSWANGYGKQEKAIGDRVKCRTALYHQVGGHEELFAQAGETVEVVREEPNGTWEVENTRGEISVQFGTVFERGKDEAEQVVEKSDKKVVAVDLNRTLATGSGPEDFGEPTVGAADAMQRIRDMGYEVAVNSVVGDVGKIARWLDEHSIPYDHVNYSPTQPQDSSGKLHAAAYVDDRAVPFRGDWTQTLDELWAVAAKRCTIAHEKSLVATPDSGYVKKAADSVQPLVEIVENFADEMDMVKPVELFTELERYADKSEWGTSEYSNAILALATDFRDMTQFAKDRDCIGFNNCLENASREAETIWWVKEALYRFLDRAAVAYNKLDQMDDKPQFKRKKSLDDIERLKQAMFDFADEMDMPERSWKPLHAAIDKLPDYSLLGSFVGTIVHELAAALDCARRRNESGFKSMLSNVESLVQTGPEQLRIPFEVFLGIADVAYAKLDEDDRPQQKSSEEMYDEFKRLVTKVLDGSA